MISEDSAAKPLGMIVDAYLWLHSRTSFRALLFGSDPDKPPTYIVTREGRWFNRHTLVDFYAMTWPIFGCLLLWWTSASLKGRPMSAILIGLIAIYRLNELLGAMFYVLISRARFDAADARKLATSLLAYVEPILFFAILHGALAIYLSGINGSTDGTGYLLGGRPWNWSTMLHYSISCYT